MLICEFPQPDPGGCRRIVEASPSDNEAFVRDDGSGAIILAGAARPVGAATCREVSILFTGGRTGTAAGDWLFLVGLWTPHDFRDEFVAWYRMEHMPILLECKTWDGCRFVEERVAEGSQFYAMHQLSDRAGLDSPERHRSRATPWFGRLAQQPWFDGAFTRMLYRRLPVTAGNVGQAGEGRSSQVR